MVDNNTFEEVINLKDKPSVRKHRTPEMDEIYRQGVFNHLFSIEEAAEVQSAFLSGKRLVIAGSFFIAVTMATAASVGVVVVSSHSSMVEPTPSAVDKPIDVGAESTDTSRVSEAYNKNAVTSTSIPVTSSGTTTDAWGGCRPPTPVEEVKNGNCFFHNMTLCRSEGYCHTMMPHRLNWFSDVATMMQRYVMMTDTINCHPLFSKTLCSLIGPPCRVRTSQTDHVFDIFNPRNRVPSPCRSLCMEVERCLEDGKSSWRGMCRDMPESLSTDVCFASSGRNDSEVKCNLNCLNGGSCFLIRETPLCSCREGFSGRYCERIADSLYSAVPNDQCFGVPDDCQASLPYNLTKGISMHGGQSANFTAWDTIEPFFGNKADEKRVFCGILYPQCDLHDNDEVFYVNCKKQCQSELLFSSYFYLLAMGFPALNCDLLPDAGPNGTTCLS